MQIHEGFNKYKGMPTAEVFQRAYCIDYVPGYCGETRKVAISYKLHNCWQIFDIESGAIYTPQAFEAKFGYLPPCPPSANKETRKLYYSHRKPFKGFKPTTKQKPHSRKGEG